jgi:hypothetical protein
MNLYDCETSVLPSQIAIQLSFEQACAQQKGRLLTTTSSQSADR